MDVWSRQSINAFDNAFSSLHKDRNELIFKTGDEILFRENGESNKGMMPISVGTCAIRSAAVVEQMINGVTVRLWDDPFEWTLPEQLPTVKDLIEYFDEVEAFRKRGFRFLNNDEDLQKQIPAPVELKTLDYILSKTKERSKRLLLEAKTLLLQIKVPEPKRH